MLHSFDLFRMDSGDDPLWIGSVNDMESAEEMIRENAGATRARFLVWAQETQSKCLYDATKDEIIPIKDSVEV